MASFRHSKHLLGPIVLSSLLSLHCGGEDSSSSGSGGASSSSSTSSTGGGGAGGSAGAGGGDGGSAGAGGAGGGAPAILDETFGNGGVVTTAFSGGNGDKLRAIARQADGKVVLAGTTNEFNASFGFLAGEVLLVRVGVDGAIDKSFGLNGKVLTSIGLRADPDVVVVQADQKIVVVGHWVGGNGHAQLFMARVAPSGALDSSFGKGGIALIDKKVASVGAAVFAPDGKLVLEANDIANQPFLMRLLPDGSLDPAFGTAGVQTTFGPTVTSFGPMVVQADGKIVGAKAVGTGASGETKVVRLLPDGAVDTAFGVGGEATASLGAEGETPLALALTKDGKILVGGKADVAGKTYAEAALLRLGANGTLDTTFGGGDGVVRVEGKASMLSDIVLDGMGRILAGGNYDTYAGVVMRFSPEGVFDTSYGTAGIATSNMPQTVHLIAGTGGEVFIAGTGLDTVQDRTDFIVSRVTSSGIVDASFGANGRALYNSDATKDIAAQMLIEPDGKILSAGSVVKAMARKSWMTRHLPDGTLDTSFGDGGRLKLGTPSLVEGLARTADGHLLVAVSGPSAVHRYDTLGKLDTSFGTNGIMAEKFDPASGVFYGALALDTKGNVLVGGNTSLTDCTLGVLRTTPEGVLDTTFDGDGRVTQSLPKSSSCGIRALAVQPDGKIVAAGSSGLAGPVVLRYEANGALDMAFGQSGIAKPSKPGVPFELDRMALSPDGKIVVAGYSALAAAWVVVRLDPTGQLDDSFGDQGLTGVKIGSDIVGMHNFHYEGPGLAVLQDGSVFGGAAKVVGTNEQMLVFRLGPDGKLDTSFGDAGQAIVPQRPGNFAAYGIGIQPGGKIVLGGRGFSPESGTDFALVRLDP